MIIKTFDNGWGPEFPAKQYEQEIVTKLMAEIIKDESHTVMINSTWYTKEYHQEVLEWLRNNRVDRIVLVSMLDAAIPQPSWYAEFGCPVVGVGYYPGRYNVDYWALVMNRYHDPIAKGILLASDHIDTPFMCLNRKPHWHRRRLYQQLTDLNLLDRGLVSMGGERQLALDVVHDNLAPNAAPGEYGIPNDLVSLGHMDNWARCLLNIVTETVYDINQNGFVSEKIYKPILGYRPFLVYDTDGATKWLTDRGFKTFTKDFKDISDLDLSRPENIAPFLVTLSEQPIDYYRHKLLDLRNKVMYNKTQFAEYARSQQAIIDKGISCQI